jgi:hypothetical protein
MTLKKIQVTFAFFFLCIYYLTIIRYYQMQDNYLIL